MLQRHKSYYILYGTILLYCYSQLNLRIFFLTASKLFTYKHVPNLFLSIRYKNYIFITCPEKEKNLQNLILLSSSSSSSSSSLSSTLLFTKILCRRPSFYTVVSAIYNIISYYLYALYIRICTILNII